VTGRFPLGKLPAEVLAELLGRITIDDPRVVIGPRPGEDAAVLDAGGGQYLVAKTDPITFATDEIGWYAVHVNANDIAAMGGRPTWFMATLLLPGGEVDQALVARIFDQITSACRAVGASLIGGHTEMTYGIDRPIMVGMMLGLAPRDRVITTGGAQPGDVLLVTKGVPLEATAIIAREKGAAFGGRFSPAFLRRCASALHDPGISVVRDAAIALEAGRVHAMHDPTEGGLATGLWEMAEASSRRLLVDPHAAVLPDGRALCEAAGLDPLGAIASGALLMAVHPEDADTVRAALEGAGIAVHAIGHVESGPAGVIDVSGDPRPLPRPARDEIARLYE
jgi:hydrogenase maturation factor